jgi:hypothetical protein
MKKWILFFIIMIGTPCNYFSQVVNDAGLWTTINVEKKINKRLELFFTEEYRRKENLTQTNLFYTDFGFSLRPARFLKFSLSYRSIQKYMEDETYSFRHRLMLDILLKKKIGNITASFRERVQTEVRNVHTSENGKLLEWYFRSKIELKYDLDKPIKPYISTELLYQLNDPRNIESNKTWRRVRYAAGLEYKMNDRHSFSGYYIIQRGFNVSAPQNSYILGLAYTLSL